MLTKAFVPISTLSKPINTGGLVKATSGANMTNPANNTPQTPAPYNPNAPKEEKPPFQWQSQYMNDPNGNPFNYQQPFSFDPKRQAPATQSWGVASQALGMQMPQFQQLYGNNGVEGKWQTGPTYNQGGEFSQQSFSSPINANNIGQNAGLYAPYMTQALDKLSNLQQGDYGLSQPIVEKMKVAEGQSINKGFDAQKEQAKRALHNMGIQDSSAALNEMQDIDTQRLQGLSDAYNKIDIENAKTANQQKLDTMYKLAGFGTQAAQLGEQGRQTDLTSLLNSQKLGEDSRQFNVTGLFDQGKLQNDLYKFLETGQYNRANLLDQVQSFLKNYDLDRLKMMQGLEGQNAALLNARREVLPVNFAYGGY